MASNSTLKNKIKIIEEPTEKHEMWIFTDTKRGVEKKVVFKWNTLFQAFHNKEFQFFLLDDLRTKLSKSIYKTISKYRLH